MCAVAGAGIAHGDERAARIGGRVKAIEVRQVADGQRYPVKAPAGEMVAAGARADVAHVHDDVEAFVDAVEVTLVAPQLESLAGDALEERRES